MTYQYLILITYVINTTIIILHSAVNMLPALAKGDCCKKNVLYSCPKVDK